MSFFSDNLDKIKIGLEGEEKVRNFFKSKNVKFMQVDIVFYSSTKQRWCVGEIKTQEKYLSPPFDGHGLPEWQIEARIDFYKATKCIPYLIVNCLSDNCFYFQSILKLMEGKKFKTKGLKSRVIFPIESFEKILI
jgi:hypothetical protein